MEGMTLPLAVCDCLLTFTSVLLFYFYFSAFHPFPFSCLVKNQHMIFCVDFFRVPILISMSKIILFLFPPARIFIFFVSIFSFSF